MENATKALIIAAAILIAIVLISLAVFVLGQGTGATQEVITGVDKAKVDAYNTEWKAYEGNKVTATKVKQLISAVNSHNIQAEDDSKEIGIASAYVTTKGTQKTQFETNDSFKMGNTYKVTTDVDESTGYINRITIE